MTTSSIDGGAVGRLTKYGTGANAAPREAPNKPSGDQGMHQDYGNNTMLVPSDERPDCVAGICYLNHVRDSGGATGVVPYHPSLPKYGMPAEGEDGWGRAGDWGGRDVRATTILLRIWVAFFSRWQR